MRRTLLFSLVCAVILCGAAVAVAENGVGPELTVSAQDFDEFLPQAAYNTAHQEYLVVWHDHSPIQSRAVMGKRLDRWGNTIAEFTIAFNPTRDSAQPSVAYDPVRDGYLVAYIRDVFGDGSDWDVMGRLVPWDGPSGSFTEVPINTWGSHQWNPKVGYGITQQEYFVTWNNEDQTGAVPLYISGVRVNPGTGTTIGGGFTIASGPEHRHSPELAYNHARNEYLIVYTMMNGAQGDIMAVRMNAGGSILGGGEFPVANWVDGEEYPSVAASPAANKYLVVWHSLTASNAKDVYGRFVNGDGSIDGAPVHFHSTILNEQYPAVHNFRGSDQFFVSWSQQYSNLGGAFGVWGQGIRADHAMDVHVVVRTVYTGEDPDCNEVAAAGGAINGLVVWENRRHPSGPYDIHGRMVFDPFGDGFETGNLNMWSSHVP